jgi:hypothetical protein
VKYGITIGAIVLRVSAIHQCHATVAIDTCVVGVLVFFAKYSGFFVVELNPWCIIDVKLSILHWRRPVVKALVCVAVYVRQFAEVARDWWPAAEAFGIDVWGFEKLYVCAAVMIKALALGLCET